MILKLINNFDCYNHLANYLPLSQLPTTLDVYPRKIKELIAVRKRFIILSFFFFFIFNRNIIMFKYGNVNSPDAFDLNY